MPLVLAQTVSTGGVTGQEGQEGSLLSLHILSVGGVQASPGVLVCLCMHMGMCTHVYIYMHVCAHTHERNGQLLLGDAGDSDGR